MKITHIPGKDAPAEETIANILQQLERVGIITETVNWLTPAPNCWSVHLRCREYPYLYTNGKGRSREACHASALGEFIERLATSFLFAEYYLPADPMNESFAFYPNEKWFPADKELAVSRPGHSGGKILSGELLDFYNPEMELLSAHLIDNSSWDGKNKNHPVCCLPFVNLRTSRTTYFPISLLNNLYVSNGMAAGNSTSECEAQALSEIIERYVKNRVIAGGLSLPEVPEDHLHQEVRDILRALQDAGYAVTIRDASLGGGFPVICGLLTAKDNGGAYAAFGASCRFQVAIERTLTELLQGRDLQGLANFSAPSHNLTEVADPFNLESHFVDSDGLLSWRMFRDDADFSFVPWNFSGTTSEELARLIDIIEKNNFTIYRAEYNFLNIPCCRFLVPGMSEIYPVDDLIWNNKNATAPLRASLLELPEMNKKKRLQLLNGIETLGLRDSANLGELMGIIFPEDSPWSTLTIGELRALVHLANKQREEALPWVEWCIDHAGLPQKRTRLYRCTGDLLRLEQNGFTLKQFAGGLQRFYHTEEIAEAKKIISGKTIFPGLDFGPDWLTVSPTHAKLVDLFKRINTFKQHIA